jgi:alpha-L-fucosidase
MHRRSFLKGMLTAGTASFLAPRLLSVAGAAEAIPIQSEKSLPLLSLAIPTAEQLAWHDMELGMFFHFDIPVYVSGKKPRSAKELPNPNLYQPTKLDTDQWMEAAKAFGAKYAVFVAKHESGFLQWQSDIYPYGVKQSSWRNGKGDVVADFVKSCHKYGIKPGFYASLMQNTYFDVVRPGLVKNGDAEAQARYVRISEQMLTELWTRYGKLFELWFDGGIIPPSKGGPDLAPIIQKLQPHAILYQGPPTLPNLIRWVGNERGIAPYPCWGTANTGTAEDGFVEKAFAGNPDGKHWIPGECDVPLRNHDWMWKPNRETSLYSLDELMEKYYCSVGRGCNLLVNACINPDGLVPEADFNRFAEFGKEIKRRFGKPQPSTAGAGKTVTLALGNPTPVNHVIVMEDIAAGQRVRAYKIEGRLASGDWKTLCDGVSIGHKRIQRFENTTVDAVRFVATQSVAEPKIRQLSAVYVA